MFDFVATMLTLKEEPSERELFYQTQCEKGKIRWIVFFLPYNKKARLGSVKTLEISLEILMIENTAAASRLLLHQWFLNPTSVGCLLHSQRLFLTMHTLYPGIGSQYISFVIWKLTFILQNSNEVISWQVANFSQWIIISWRYPGIVS